MGTYLSTPITSKHSESGNDLPDSSSAVNDNNNNNNNDGSTSTHLPVSWGVVDMQGWRKSMEDAHIARTDVPIGNNSGAAVASPSSSIQKKAKVFAVFDGHGGAEVARFCQMHLVDVLLDQDGWKEMSTLLQHQSHPPNNSNDDDKTVCDENNETTMKMADSIGQALIQSFHALDRLIDDPSAREEIERWRLERPPVYVHDSCGGATTNTITTSSDVDKAVQAEKEVDVKTTTNKMQNLHLIGDVVRRDEYDSDDSSGGEIVKCDDEMKGGQHRNDCGEEGGLNTSDGEAMSGGTCIKQEEGGETTTNESSSLENEEKVESDTGETSDSINNDVPEGIINDDSSSSDEESDDDEGEEPRGIIGTDAYTLISKLFQINGSATTPNDQDPVLVDNPTIEQVVEEEEDQQQEEDTQQNQETHIPTPEQLLNPPTGIVAPSASIPTKIMNGRKVCNLPDHPVHAGCTSIVAVIVENTLVVANAGDSRAVLCRAGGLTEPLSFDHKPLQKREISRITRAGGFVNQFGRVNGNLNLSRSIGDLKYKQVPGIPPADQMITAEPDILCTTLRPGDEFIILGCDGIWDCLTNEECVKYVRDRIDTKSPVEIGTEMLDEIVSEDPRASQGIGGDNMTVMIIDLLPATRKYTHE